MPTGGVYGLRKVQLGKETTKGTPVAATELMLATCELTPGYDVYRGRSPFGIIAENAGPVALLKKDVDVSLIAEGITYEQIGWFLALGLGAESVSGAGPYTHTFSPSGAALWAPLSATLEGRWTDGTTHEDIEVEYVQARRLRFSCEENGVLRAELDGFGRQMTDAAITGALSLPTTLDIIRASDFSFYANTSFALADVNPPVAGKFSNNVISFNLEIDCGNEPFHGINGSPTFSENKERQKSFRLTAQLLYDAAGTNSIAAERAIAQAMTTRFFTLNAVGTSPRAMRFVLAGKHEQGEIFKIGERNGMDVAELNILGHYDPTSAKLLSVVVINSDTTEPT